VDVIYAGLELLALLIWFERADWPKGHKWIFYKLDIEDIFLIDNYGGAKPLTVSEYYRGSVQSAVAR